MDDRLLGDQTLGQAIEESLDKDGHFDASGVMKEAVFGWYPPANNPWQTYRVRQPTYNKECLYKYKTSKYASDRRTLGIARSPSCEIPNSPSPHGHIRPTSRQASFEVIGNSSTSKTNGYYKTTSRQGNSRQNVPLASRSNSRPSSQDFRTSRPSSHQDLRYDSSKEFDMHVSGKASQFCGEGYNPNSSLSDFLKNAPKPPSAHKTKPAKAWAYHVPQTTAHLLQNISSETARPEPCESIPQLPPIHTCISYQDYLLSKSQSRAQSATHVRSRVTTETRQVKSAGRQRSPCDSSSKFDKDKDLEKVASPSTSEEELREQIDADAEVAAAVVVSDEDIKGEEEPTGVEEVQDAPVEETLPMSTPPPLDYNEQLEKYGWKMQIPGDPLGLKTPCLPKRAPFSRTCHVSNGHPDPPKVHAENYDTFFYNTIPRHPMSFDIHPEFVSEILNAKRMELQKREGGINYRYKNFSFVY